MTANGQLRDRLRAVCRGRRQHADLDLGELTSVAQTPWPRAARGLITEAMDAVSAAKDGSVERARALSAAVEERRYQSALRKADRIAQKRLNRDGSVEQD